MTPKIAGEVSGADAEYAHQLVAHFHGQLSKLGVREALEISRRRDL